jgi:hypothetical protein
MMLKKTRKNTSEISNDWKDYSLVLLELNNPEGRKEFIKIQTRFNKELKQNIELEENEEISTFLELLIAETSKIVLTEKEPETELTGENNGE